MSGTPGRVSLEAFPQRPLQEFSLAGSHRAAPSGLASQAKETVQGSLVARWSALCQAALLPPLSPDS